MKKAHHTIVFNLILLFMFGSHLSAQSKFGDEKNVIIAGTITNYDYEKSPKTIQLIRNDLLGSIEKYVEEIKKDGTFVFEFSIAYAQEIAVKYSSFIYLVCVPGDSISMHIKNEVLTDREMENFLSFSDSKTGETNALVCKFYNELLIEDYYSDKLADAEKNLSPKEFNHFIMHRKKEHTLFYENFKKENHTTKLFDKWVKDKLYYKSMYDLMRYKSMHPDHNNMDRDSFRLPIEYFDFLEDYDMDDNTMFSTEHSSFLKEFYSYSSRNPKSSFDKALLAHKNEEVVKAWNIIKEMIEFNSSGFTKDLFYTKFYLSFIKGQQLEIFDSVYDPSFTKQNYFLNTLDTEHKKLKAYLSNQKIDMANLESIDSDIVAGIIDTLSLKYKGKVIYIDFWAPWCSPCMKEMKYTKEIQAHYKDKDVVFLFLANRCKEDSWKATIANKELSGEHILLSDDQYNVLSGILNITGIPHYTLIDKNGNIVSKDALRPSDNEKLIEEINNLL